MLVFLAIALASFIMLAGSFIFGHDHDFGHGDVGHVDGDAVGDHTISVFSSKVICTFTMGFGCAGAIAKFYGASFMFAPLYGVAAGVVLALVIYVFLSAVSRQQSSSLVQTQSLIGASGTVTVSIDPGGLGEVGVSAAGQYMNFCEKSAQGEALPKGATIRVVNSIGSELVVEKA